MYADLHFHTTCSDGKHSVQWVLHQLEEAKKKHSLGLAVLTDHDGVQGFDDFKVGIGSWWTPICASELSCTFTDPEQPDNSIELHLLIYGLNPKDPELITFFDRFREERRKRFFRICERIQAAGYPLDAEALAEKHPGVLGRPHVADALVESGVVKTRSEAFDRFLKDHLPYAVRKWRFPLEDAIRYAKKNGCKTSIAHPGQYGFEKNLLKTFRDCGVDAIEVYHPRHGDLDTRKYWDIARELGFKMSGGSDFHASESDRIGVEPSLGRTQYPLETAKDFLGELI